MAEITGVVGKIWDARAMQVDGTRIGAGYKKDLSDQTTGGTLAEGVTVKVTYDQKGKWNNATKIEVLSGATALAPAPTGSAPAGGVDYTERGGKYSRTTQFRHADEIARMEAMNVAAQLVDTSGPKSEWLPELASIAEVVVAFAEDVIDAKFIKEQFAGASTPAVAPAAVDPTPAETAPQQSAASTAAAAAATQSGPADQTDALAAFMND